MGCGWKLDSENLAYAAVVLFYTRELTTGTAFGSVGGVQVEYVDIPNDGRLYLASYVWRDQVGVTR